MSPSLPPCTPYLPHRSAVGSGLVHSAHMLIHLGLRSEVKNAIEGALARAGNASLANLVLNNASSPLLRNHSIVLLYDLPLYTGLTPSFRRAAALGGARDTRGSAHGASNRGRMSDIQQLLAKAQQQQSAKSAAAARASMQRGESGGNGGQGMIIRARHHEGNRHRTS